jgi:aminoglycoside phosphotransferase (APT) family kinase protein
MPSEYIVNCLGQLVIPHMCMERMKNEVTTMRYIQSNTNIPIPNLHCAFEDHSRYYIITNLVPGVAMAKLLDDKKALVIKELEGYVAQMHAIKSNIMGGFSDDVILLYHVGVAMPRDQVLKLHESTISEFVLCHNDLSQHNVIVDETTLKVTAILDWEYAGFFPPKFDGTFYLHPGPLVALEGEENDVPKLLEVLKHWKA